MKFCFDCANLYEIETGVCPHCGADTTLGAYPKEPYHLTPGSMLKGGKYLIGRAIGYGGFGVTYAALDTVLQRRVAIKEYLPSTCATRSPGTLNVSVFNGDDNSDAYIKGLQSFVNEADRLKKFRNFGGIVTIYDSFAENDTAYIVMELLDGKTLKTVLDERGTLPYDEVLDIVAPVLHALEYVHREGIIHRDISPENVFICSNGEVKLLDFGAARYATANVSKSLSVILKPGYAPAEQYSSRGEQGPWSDVYAVGATMYRALTGVTPDEALERGANDTLKPPSKLGVKMPKNAETALLNALNVNYECRTRSAGEFLYELTGGQEVITKLDGPIGPKPGALPKWVYGLLAGLLAAGAIFATLVLTGVIDLRPYHPGPDPVVSDLVPVPDLIGMTEEEAQAAYPEWTIISNGREYTNEITMGCIMMQSPPYGQLVASNRRSITLKISAGPQNDEKMMPYLRAESLEKAVEIMGSRGYSYSIEYDYDDTVVAGRIKGTEPEAGTDMSSGGEVTLIVSLGGLLSKVELTGAEGDISLAVGGAGAEVGYRILPGNTDPDNVSIEFFVYDESVAGYEGGVVVPRSAGRTALEIRASMVNAVTGETVSVYDRRAVIVAEAGTTPAVTAEPSATAQTTATNAAAPTPKPTPKPTAKPTPKPTATPYVASIAFNSSAFESAFRTFAHKYGIIKTLDAPITQEVINSVTTLDLRNSGLTDISDAAKFKYVTTMVLSNNNISNLRPLYGLTRLKSLVIYGNPVSEANIWEFVNHVPECTVNSDYGTISEH